MPKRVNTLIALQLRLCQNRYPKRCKALNVQKSCRKGVDAIAVLRTLILSARDMDSKERRKYGRG